MNITGHEHPLVFPAPENILTTSRGDVTAFAECKDCGRNVFVHFHSFAEMVKAFDSQKALA